MTAVPDILAGDGDPRLSELQVSRAWVWEGIPAHSRKQIYGLGTIHCRGVSWHSCRKSDRSRKYVGRDARAETIRPATIPARGEPMSNLANVVQQLRKERDLAQRRIGQLDEALEALTGLGGARGVAGRRSRTQASGRRRTMSAEARKRIAAAQRARWAKWKAAQRGK